MIDFGCPNPDPARFPDFIEKNLQVMFTKKKKKPAFYGRYALVIKDSINQTDN